MTFYFEYLYKKSYQKWNPRLTYLGKKMLELWPRITNLRQMIAKLRQIIEENARRDARVELEQKNKELEARLAIFEQSSLVTLQNDKETIAEALPEIVVSDVDLSNAVVDQRNNVDTKTSEEKEMDAFLVEVNKKSINDKIREKRREKKIQHKTTAKDSSSVISDLTHCEEDLSMTSTEPVTLPEQTSVGTLPVKSSMADNQVPASESYEDADMGVSKNSL